jgi:hypothetical protein
MISARAHEASTWGLPIAMDFVSFGKGITLYCLPFQPAHSRGSGVGPVTVLGPRFWSATESDMGISFFDFACWIYFISSFIRMIEIDSMSVSRFGSS